MSRLRIRVAGPRDRELLTRLLRELSAESAYLRFQTGIGAEPSPALVTALLPEGLRGGAVLGFLDGRPVAHGLWARVGRSSAAEIALVVADPHQAQGFGTQMATSLMADLAARGIGRVEVFASASNVAVSRMVARQAPGAERDRDGATVTYTFETRAATCQGDDPQGLWLRAG